MDGIWIVYLFLAAFPALIIFAAVYKYLEILKVSHWSSTPGRIMTSASEARSVSTGGPGSDDTELRNFAKVEFEYKVANKTYRGNRVSVGEDLGNFEVAETLARYPVGKAVTVYYDPNHRDRSLLERDMPPGIWKGIIIVVLVLIGLIVGAIFGFGKLGSLVAAMIPNVAEAPFVAACIGFALVSALFILGFQGAEARARKWPTASARIERSGVRQYYDTNSDADSSRMQSMFRSDVIYSYEVAGVRYTGDKLSAGRISSNVEAVARRAAARYPVGTTLEIHYNPDNPSDSAIGSSGTWLWLLWLIPAAMLTLAYFVAR